MARMLEIRRHTDNDGDTLNRQGVADAVRIGRDELEGPYAVAISSGAQRATQTVACMLAGSGQQVPGGVVVDTGFRSDREEQWRAAYQVGGSHLDDFRRVAPDLVAEDGAVLAGALRRTLDLLDDGERALVVGHSPTSEAAVLGLTGRVVDPLDKGEAVIVTFDGRQHTVTR